MIGSETFSLSQKEPTFRIDGLAFDIRNILMASVTNNGPSIIYIYQGGPNGAAVGTLSVGVTQLFYVSPAQELTFQVDKTMLSINGSSAKLSAPSAEVYAVFGDEIITGNNGRNGTMYAYNLNANETITARQLGFDLIRGIAINSPPASTHLILSDSNNNGYDIDWGTTTGLNAVSCSSQSVNNSSVGAVQVLLSDTAIIAGLA